MTSKYIRIMLYSVNIICSFGLELGSYGANPSQVSVSGLSSGAYMAVQVHVALSNTFIGAGVVSGGPYYCANGSYNTASTQCMTNDPPIQVIELEKFTKLSADNDLIDSLDNMRDDKVYLFAGSNDVTIVPEVMRSLEDYYTSFVQASNIHSEFSYPAGHSFVTAREGNPCETVSLTPWISDCDYDTAFELLNHIYGGNLLRPEEFITSDYPLSTFDQSSFVTEPTKNGLDNEGFVYVPTRCNRTNSNCRVHVVLHGCLQSRFYFGETYPRLTGYLEVAEMNDIIVIYPQTYPHLIKNPASCWDWWGFTGDNYAFKTAVQIEAIRRMVERVTS